MSPNVFQKLMMTHSIDIHVRMRKGFFSIAKAWPSEMKQFMHRNETE